MLLTEYDQAEHMRLLKEEGIEEGIEQGRAEGIEQGVLHSIKSMMKTLGLSLEAPSVRWKFLRISARPILTCSIGRERRTHKGKSAFLTSQPPKKSEQRLLSSFHKFHGQIRAMSRICPFRRPPAVRFSPDGKWHLFCQHMVFSLKLQLSGYLKL